MITLRFVTAGDLASDAIRAEERCWASHVECRMPDGTLLGAHVDGGVQARPADYDATWTQELFVDLPATPRQADAFHAFLTAQVGKPYDLAAIADIAFGEAAPVDPARAPDWICCELIVAALLAAAIVPSAPCGVRTSTVRDALAIAGALAPVGAPTQRRAT
jgi:hypothetical protein